MTSFDQQLSSHRCRLLLPTGKYVIAEVHRPGAYRRYSTPVDGVGGVGWRGDYCPTASISCWCDFSFDFCCTLVGFSWCSAASKYCFPGLLNYSGLFSSLNNSFLGLCWTTMAYFAASKTVPWAGFCCTIVTYFAASKTITRTYLEPQKLFPMSLLYCSDLFCSLKNYSPGCLLWYCSLKNCWCFFFFCILRFTRTHTHTRNLFPVPESNQNASSTGRNWPPCPGFQETKCVCGRFQCLCHLGSHISSSRVDLVCAAFPCVQTAVLLPCWRF